MVKYSEDEFAALAGDDQVAARRIVAKLEDYDGALCGKCASRNVLVRSDRGERPPTFYCGDCYEVTIGEKSALDLDF
jgi:hypothetical protein